MEGATRELGGSTLVNRVGSDVDAYDILAINIKNRAQIGFPRTA